MSTKSQKHSASFSKLRPERSRQSACKEKQHIMFQWDCKGFSNYFHTTVHHTVSKGNPNLITVSNWFRDVVNQTLEQDPDLSSFKVFLTKFEIVGSLPEEPLPFLVKSNFLWKRPEQLAIPRNLYEVGRFIGKSEANKMVFEKFAEDISANNNFSNITWCDLNGYDYSPMDSFCVQFEPLCESFNSFDIEIGIALAWDDANSRAEKNLQADIAAAHRSEEEGSPLWQFVENNKP
jgi:hypothetical protein